MTWPLWTNPQAPTEAAEVRRELPPRPESLQRPERPIAETRWADTGAETDGRGIEDPENGEIGLAPISRFRGVESSP